MAYAVPQWILIADDDSEFADSLAEKLSDSGYLAEVAYDGQSALEKFRSRRFHIVLTDLRMPGLDGMGLLEGIKKIDNQAVVVVITGFGTIEAAVNAIREGAYDFITKPIKFDSIKVVVDRALEKRRLVKQLDFFKGLTLAVLISVPLWLILGIILAYKFL